VEDLPNNRYGVALHLLMTVNYNASAPPSPVTRT